MIVIEENKEYSLIGKIDSLNHGETWANLSLLLEDGTKQTVKITPDLISNFHVNGLYYFELIGALREDKPYLKVTNFKTIFEYAENDELERILRIFYDYSPISQNELKTQIYDFINDINNQTINMIVNKIMNKHKDDFFIYPAATRFHHTFISGLAYHTLTMLKLSKGFFDIYPYLNKDLVYAGIILHDMGKIYELSTPFGPEYTVDGGLIGHLALESNELMIEASKLNIEKKEEILLLNHMILSSHGRPEFGSCHKPMIPEAYLLWYLDTIDSKFTVMGMKLEEVCEGEFTDPISVLEKNKIYKHML